MARKKKIDLELWKACYKENVSKVKSMILCGADPCVIPEGKTTAALHRAVSSTNDDSTDILEVLLTSVTNINVRGCDIFNIISTPLLGACERGNVKCAKLLVDNGADVTLKEKGGNGVIHVSVKSGKISMVKECLYWDGVDINTRGEESITALIAACQTGQVDVIRFLLSAGADVTLKDGYGYPALWYGRHNKEILELIHNHVMDIMESAYHGKFLWKHKNRPHGASAGLSTAFVNLGLASSSGTIRKQNTTAITNIIRRTFPDITPVKIKSILTAIEESGFDFNADNLKDLTLLEPSDFGTALKPLQVRKLVNVFKIESELQGIVVDF